MQLAIIVSNIDRVNRPQFVVSENDKQRHRQQNNIKCGQLKIMIGHYVRSFSSKLYVFAWYQQT